MSNPRILLVITVLGAIGLRGDFTLAKTPHSSSILFESEALSSANQEFIHPFTYNHALRNAEKDRILFLAEGMDPLDMALDAIDIGILRCYQQGADFTQALKERNLSVSTMIRRHQKILAHLTAYVELWLAATAGPQQLDGARIDLLLALVPKKTEHAIRGLKSIRTIGDLMKHPKYVGGRTYNIGRTNFVQLKFLLAHLMTLAQPTTRHSLPWSPWDQKPEKRIELTLEDTDRIDGVNVPTDPLDKMDLNYRGLWRTFREAVRASETTLRDLMVSNDLDRIYIETGNTDFVGEVVLKNAIVRLKIQSGLPAFSQTLAYMGVVHWLKFGKLADEAIVLAHTLDRFRISLEREGHAQEIFLSALRELDRGNTKGLGHFMAQAFIHYPMAAFTLKEWEGFLRKIILPEINRRFPNARRGSTGDRYLVPIPVLRAS